MTDVRRSFLLFPVVVGCLALTGCGSGAKQTAHYTTTPPTTISDVGVTTSGTPPKSSTQASPYKPSVTRACLIRHGAHHVVLFRKPTGLKYPFLAWNRASYHAINMFFARLLPRLLGYQTLVVATPTKA